VEGRSNGSLAGGVVEEEVWLDDLLVLLTAGRVDLAAEERVLLGRDDGLGSVLRCGFEYGAFALFWPSSGRKPGSVSQREPSSSNPSKKLKIWLLSDGEKSSEEGGNCGGWGKRFDSEGSYEN
jgi:hypothetical protein